MKLRGGQSHLLAGDEVYLFYFIYLSIYEEVISSIVGILSLYHCDGVGHIFSVYIWSYLPVKISDFTRSIWFPSLLDSLVYFIG